MTIHEAYQKAGELHGHYCPGLAIGVRAAWEGRRALGEGSLSVMAERSACWLDGMSLVGATIGNGKLLMKDRELVGIDEEAVNARILEESKKLWTALNGCAY